MEKINLGYSIKNIPIPSERTYLLQLVEKIEAVIKRMRYKAMYFKKAEKNEDRTIPERYGLKTESCPPQIPELIPFEEELIHLIKEIKFRKVRNNFQKKLSNDIKMISSSLKTVTPADKTSNMYRLETKDYEKLLNDSITTTYKKANRKLESNINKAGKKFAKDADVVDKMEVNASNNCFFTLKDHKENFQNNPKTRLINPAKNEVGRISKIILENINNELIKKLEVNQWKSDKNVIEWFKGIQNKNECKFVVFDIEQFYPSIKETVLLKALEFAKLHTKVTPKDINLIIHSRRSLLFNQGEVWVKKDEENFDVTMGAYDGAEVSELVGIYLQYLLSEKYEKSDFGLYRDDGLAIFRNVSGSQSEKIKKTFQKIFKENHLDITINCNMKIVNYLDVTLNLNDGSYQPFHKPNDEILYIHSESNHPPSITKQLPVSIESRLTTLSSTKEIFDKSAKTYQEALERSGYKYKLTYKEIDDPENSNVQRKKNRKRNIIWFNPPYSKSVSTNVGKIFLKLVDKHFPPHHKFRKIFNRNNVKISYSCMPSMKAKINQHNKKVLQKRNDSVRSENIRTCNCPRNAECPLDKKCIEKDLLYSAEITSNLTNYDKKVYLGICSTTFKERLGNHKKAFNHEKYEHDSELSKEVWKIKRKGGQSNIKWQKLKNFTSYKPEMKRCSLCDNEKLAIALYKENNVLNQRKEIISRCRHRSKYKLKNL